MDNFGEYFVVTYTHHEQRQLKEDIGSILIPVAGPGTVHVVLSCRGTVWKKKKIKMSPQATGIRRAIPARR